MWISRKKYNEMKTDVEYYIGLYEAYYDLYSQADREIKSLKDRNKDLERVVSSSMRRCHEEANYEAD